jgi:hypothetical protein
MGFIGKIKKGSNSVNHNTLQAVSTPPAQVIKPVVAPVAVKPVNVAPSQKLPSINDATKSLPVVNRTISAKPIQSITQNASSLASRDASNATMSMDTMNKNMLDSLNSIKQSTNSEISSVMQSATNTFNNDYSNMMSSVNNEFSAINNQFSSVLSSITGSSIFKQGMAETQVALDDIAYVEKLPSVISSSFKQGFADVTGVLDNTFHTGSSNGGGKKMSQSDSNEGIIILAIGTAFVGWYLL